MTSIVTSLALIILILGHLNNAVAASVLHGIQKITLKTEVSKEARAAIASSRNHQLVKPALSPTIDSVLHPFKNILQTTSSNNDSVTLVNTTISPSYKAVDGSKLFLTKVPVSVGQSGNFALSLTTSLPLSFVRGPNCTADVVSCTGATIKLNDPDVILYDGGLTTEGLLLPTGEIIGPFVNTSSFTVGTVKSTHYTFVGFNQGVNFSAETYGDGIFSLTNGNVPHEPLIHATSWLSNGGFAPERLQAGLYLPFYDRSNDHGELTLGGYDSSRFTVTTNTSEVVYLWGLIPTSVTCTINGTTASFKTPPKSSILAVEPFYDFVTMNDDCYQLVLDTFHPQLDPITNALIVDCGFLKSGPNVQLTFEGQTFTMVPESYIFHDTVSNVCVLLFANIPGEVILGAPFLVNYYSIFDMSNQRFGFAKAVHPKFYPSHTTTK
ncbi:Vacuolar protease A [Blyttiomyces sp. JEL0837]|nr:Vacuolar protease A [Blyttiomyces sp. JEL0837]